MVWQNIGWSQAAVALAAWMLLSAVTTYVAITRMGAVQVGSWLRLRF